MGWWKLGKGARANRAASGLEYGLLIGLIAVAGLFTISSLGSDVNEIIGKPFPDASPSAEAADGVPDAVTLAELVDALPEEPVQSESFTITGIEVPVTFTMQGHASAVAHINGGSGVTTGTVSAGDTVTLGMLTSDQSLTAQDVQFVVSGFTVASWRATTQEIIEDVAPTCEEEGTGAVYDRSNVPPNIVCMSGVIRITANPTTTPLLLRVTRTNGSSGFWNAPQAAYRVNTGSGFTGWQNTPSGSISVRHGDFVQLKATTNPYRDRSVAALARIYYDNNGSLGGQLAQLNFNLITDDTGDLQPDGAVCPSIDSNCSSFGTGTSTSYEPGFAPGTDGENNFSTWGPFYARTNIDGNDFELRAYPKNYTGEDEFGPLDPTISINGGPQLTGGSGNWHVIHNGDAIELTGHTSDYADDVFEYYVQVRHAPSGHNFNLSTVRFKTNSNGWVSGLTTGDISPTTITMQDQAHGANITQTAAYTVTVSPSNESLCLLHSYQRFSPDVANSLDTVVDPILLRSTNGGASYSSLGSIPRNNSYPGGCITVNDGDMLKVIGHTSDYNSTNMQYQFRLRTNDSNATLRTIYANFRTQATGGLDLPEGSFEE